MTKKKTSFLFEESRIRKLKEISAKRGESMQATLDRMIDLMAADDARDAYPFAEDALNNLFSLLQQLEWIFDGVDLEEEMPPVPEKVQDLRIRMNIAYQLIASSPLVQDDVRAYTESLDPEEPGQVYRFGTSQLSEAEKGILRSLE